MYSIFKPKSFLAKILMFCVLAAITRGEVDLTDERQEKQFESIDHYPTLHAAIEAVTYQTADREMAAASSDAQESYLKPSSGNEDDRFGHSVAISGNTAIIGAPGDDSGAREIDGDESDNSAESAGAAYIFVRDENGWSQQAYLKADNGDAFDYFGQSVDISGDTAIIGATREASSATGVNGDGLNNDLPGAGAVYVFVRSGSTWTQQAYLKSAYSNPFQGKAFGTSVAIDGDIAVVGMPSEHGDQSGMIEDLGGNLWAFSGAVYVFKRSLNSWHQESYIKASNAQQLDSFGGSVDISEETIVVGAIGESGMVPRTNGQVTDYGSYQSGAAYIFVRSGAAWSQQAYLKASNPGRTDHFGDAVAISNDTVLIGAPRENSNAIGVNGDQTNNDDTNSGAAYVFFRSNSEWTQQAYLKDQDAHSGDLFGSSVSISGDIAVVGVPFDDSDAVGINGDPTTDKARRSGSAYSFTRIGTTWSPQSYLKASNTSGYSFFGRSVSVDGNIAIVGSPSSTIDDERYPTDPTTKAGGIYILDTNLFIKDRAFQTIDFPPIPAKLSTDEPFELSATATSGLPVTFTLFDGPGTLSENTVTLTGGFERLSIRANQLGNSEFKPARTVIRHRSIDKAHPQVYFGTASHGTPFAAHIPADKNTGTLFGTLANNQIYTLEFRVNPDQSIAPLSLQFFTSPPPSAPNQNYTFSGTIKNGELEFEIAELGISLSANLESIHGTNAPLAGFYEAKSLNNSKGSLRAIVGTVRNIYLIAETPLIVTSGLGRFERKPSTSLSLFSGGFELTTNQNAILTGSLEGAITSMTGNVTLSTSEEFNFLGISPQTRPTERLINLSTRAFVDVANAGDLITGFVIGGSEPKRVLLRAIGPTLSEFGITTALPDPSLTIYDSAGKIITEINNWAGNDEARMAMKLTGAFPLEEQSLDAVFVTTLEPGAYTMRVVNNTAPGIALSEIYDATENPNSQNQRLINISSRGQVVGGEGVLVGGFVVTGNSPKRVLVRGIGPGLSAYGVPEVLPDPAIKIFDSDQQVIASNDDWQTPRRAFPSQTTADAAELIAANTATGAFQLATGTKDAALVVTLAPGAYTVELSSSESLESGTALIEIYELPE